MSLRQLVLQHAEVVSRHPEHGARLPSSGFPSRSVVVRGGLWQSSLEQSNGQRSFWCLLRRAPLACSDSMRKAVGARSDLLWLHCPPLEKLRWFHGRGSSESTFSCALDAMALPSAASGTLEPRAVTLTVLDDRPSCKQPGAYVRHLTCSKDAPAGKYLAEELHLPEVRTS
jgi:hypothetical protein